MWEAFRDHSLCKATCTKAKESSQWAAMSQILYVSVSFRNELEGDPNLAMSIFTII